jgi:hypothetical protein
MLIFFLYVMLVMHSMLDLQHVYILVDHSVTFTGVVVQCLNLFIDDTCLPTNSVYAPQKMKFNR